MKFAMIFDTLEEMMAVIDGMDDDAPAPEHDPAVGVPLDVTGTPWIAGIHAPAKTKNKDGSWRVAKGVTPDARAAHEAAARARLAATPAPVTIAMPVQPAPVMMPVQPAPVMMPVQPAPVIMPVQPAQPVSYEMLVTLYADRVGAGRATDEMVSAWYAEIGCNPSTLQTNETHRAEMYKRLSAT